MNELSSLLWPPHYKIKKHRQAKHVKLRPSKRYGLEITVPYRFNLKEIPLILEENKTWITRQLLHFQSQGGDELPKKIEMNALNKIWSIHYLACNKKLELMERPSQEIVLIGKLEDKKKCKDKLITWLKHLANIHLKNQLQIVSEWTALSYASITIRDQKTLWGSCTANKAINLNYKLLFLPPHLVKHIMIHELAHTEHLNHSTKFWDLVARLDPAWQEHRQLLRRADQFIPTWI